MASACGRYHLVLHGEVYNFRELRRELKESGQRFVSESDSEVVLASYVHWGAESVRRLRGMFAYAIFDRHERALFLARDRFGIKPLYYHCDDGGFVFASEMKAMLASGVIRRRLDPQDP